MTTPANPSGADFYKETIFLPKTDFPMRGELPKKEPEILKKWQEMELYREIRNAALGRPKWVLHWGPPYANGRAHIGHAFTKSLKDIVNRCKQMQGYDAPLVPGWDCHGLPIEWKIEEQYREKGLDKDEVDILKFRQECREFAQTWADVQSKDFQRLGVLADWDDPYMTMKKHAEATIVREIHKFLCNGLLYKGVKPVMWSVVEKTALAEAEIEYKEHKSITIWVKFPIVKTPRSELAEAKVVIWTTTPWTMPSNRAVAYGAEIEYGLYRVDAIEDGSKALIGEKLLVATRLAEDVRQNSKISAWAKEKTFSGNDLKGVLCAHPLRGQGYDFDVPLLEGDFVTEETGTGFVHIAPSHGEDDFYLGKAAGLEITDNVSDDGRFKDHVPLFAGLSVYTQKGEMGDGNFAVLKAMDGVGNLLAKGSLRHEYPHSWRSKAPLIFRTTPQWFIAMDKEIEGAALRNKALEGIRGTQWFPSQGENRITAMIAGRPDWCISRQRAWGVPIALFLDKKTGQPLRDETVLERIGEIFEEDGSDAWFARPAQDFLGEDYRAEDFDQVLDVVDVWFESGCTHAFVCETRVDVHWPADLYLEGSDQHRGWFHSSLLESCGTRGRPPYKSVLTHGFVLDEKGYKMSKSQGNVVDPHDIMKEFGADILRLWTVTSDYSEDVKIGNDLLKNVADIYRRLRNTFRFLLGALDGFTPAERIDSGAFERMPDLEKFILQEMARIDIEIRNSIDRHDYGAMTLSLYNFCNTTLSSFYFDIRKDRLYCDRPDSFERRACRTVMAELLDFLTTRLAPIIPFTAEEVWQLRPADVFEDALSIHLRTFSPVSVKRDPALKERWDRIQSVRAVVLAALEPARASKAIGSSLEACPDIYVSGPYADAVRGLNLAELCITSGALVIEAPPPENAVTLPQTEGVGVVFKPASGKKCQRCWKVLPEVGSDPDYPDLSLRDADAVRYYLAERKVA